MHAKSLEVSGHGIHSESIAIPPVTASPVNQAIRSVSERLPALDTLRAAAILAVVFHHWLDGSTWIGRMATLGWMGVDLFFVLSGFLIGGQVFRELKTSGKLKLGRFMLRRALRTFPSYFVVFGCLWYLGQIGDVVPPWRYLTFTQNYSAPLTYSASWSLSIEEQFYFFLPMLALGLFAIVKKNPRIGTILMFSLPVLLLIAGFVVRNQTWRTHVEPAFAAGNQAAGDFNFFYFIYFRTHTHLDGLIIGVALALMQQFGTNIWAYITRFRRTLFAIGAVVLTLACYVSLHRQSLIAATAGISLASLAFGFMTASAAVAPSTTRFHFPGSHLIANLAYSMYLAHTAILPKTQAYFYSGAFDRPGLYLPLFSIVATLVLSLILYHAVERPGLWLRRKLLHS